jgi:hypothetical protein
MCTYQTDRVEVAGAGKGPDGWFPRALAAAIQAALGGAGVEGPARPRAR